MKYLRIKQNTNKILSKKLNISSKNIDIVFVAIPEKRENIKIINNKFFFKLTVRLTLAEKVLKAGEYKFYNNNIFQIIKKIKIGDTFH